MSSTDWSHFDDFDTAILSWLNTVPIEPWQIDLKIKEREVLLNSRDAYMLRRAWSQREGLRAQKLELTIFFNGRLMDSTKRINRSTSSWVKTHLAALVSLQTDCTAAVHSEADGYKYLAVQPYLNNEVVLNKPLHELLGQPLLVVASEIAAAKQHCIQQAVASGGVASEPYQMEWQGNLWKKQLTAIYLPGHQEVLTKTTHAKGEEWQIGFWRNHVSSLPQR